MTVCIVCLCSVFNRNLSICESEQTFSKGDTVWAVRKNTRSHDSQPQQGEQTNTVKDVNPPPECPFHKKPQAVEPAKDVSPPPECPFHNKQQSPASTETPPSSAGASAGKCPFTGNTQKAASQQEVADDPKDFSKATCPFIANKHQFPGVCGLLRGRRGHRRVSASRVQAVLLHAVVEERWDQCGDTDGRKQVCIRDAC
jgi:hypothetical protein